MSYKKMHNNYKKINRIELTTRNKIYVDTTDL